MGTGDRDILDQSFALLRDVESELERARAAYSDTELTDPVLFSVFYTVRAVRGLRAIGLLAEAGLAGEAETVLRSLLEDVVTLHYVIADFQNRFEKWASHCRIRDAYYAEMALRIGKLAPDVRSRLEQRIESLGGVPRGRTRDRWDVGFAAMARAVSERDGNLWFGNWFEMLYAPLCDVAHGHSGPSLRYLDSTKRGLRDDDVAVSYVLARAVMVASGLVWGLHDVGLQVDSTDWADRAVKLHDFVELAARG